MDIVKAPVIIVGSGIAGLLTALKLSDAGVNSVVVTKTRLTENSSRMAQGGIAAVLPENTTDSIEAHVRDSLEAGAGLCDESVTRSILSEGHLAIQDLMKLGVPFDHVDGRLAFTKEAAHSTRRILHAGGDATGRNIQDTLIHKVHQDPHITLYEECMALDLLVHDSRCYGVHAVTYGDGDVNEHAFLAQHTVLATGGIGQLYSHTTNPAIATGDGVALAYRAGADIQDMEFVQFHPTAFWMDGKAHFLVSEAVRGEGGVLRNHQGECFAKNYHPDGELAPRDIVTRMITTQMEQDKAQHVYLDMTHLPAEVIEQRFPTILENAQRFGVDIRLDWIPVAPAAHYGMGGVKVNTIGETSIHHLYAVGEVVSSGLHGANRLASNSLLECVVLARRVAAHVETFPEVLGNEVFQVLPSSERPVRGSLPGNEQVWMEQSIQELRELMWAHCGIARDAQGLQAALATLGDIETRVSQNQWQTQVPLGAQLHQLVTVAQLICQSALLRQESRGGHYRLDYPNMKETPEHSLQSVKQQEVLA